MLECKKEKCIITKKKDVDCLVITPEVIFPKIESYISEEGISTLVDMYNNAEKYHEEICIINKKSYKKCLKIFNLILPKRSIYISRQGITALENAMSQKPETIVEEPPPVIEVTPPGQDLYLLDLIKKREEAELEVLDMQEYFDLSQTEEDKNSYRTLLDNANNNLILAKNAEKEYLEKIGK